MSILQRIKNRVVTNSRLMHLGDSWGNKLWVLIVSFWFPIKKRIGIRPGVRGTTLRLKKFGKPFNFVVYHGLDFEVLREVFVEEEYMLTLPAVPSVIFDLGSNVGASVAYFKLKYPQARVFAFEPDPNNIPKLKQNTAQFEGVNIYPYAVTDIDRTVVLYSHPQKGLSSSIAQSRAGQKGVEVSGRSLDGIMDELSLEKVDLLKFDIEGAEYGVFKSFQQMGKINFFVGELHFDLMDVSTEDFLSLFQKCKINLRKRSIHRFIFEATC